MGKVELYRQALRALDDWEPYLRRESGLPGPRGNLELARAVAEEGDEGVFRRLLTYDAARAPANTPDEFLHFCGVLGLGKLLAAGNHALLPSLRAHANDPRWRTREAVAMALQWWGGMDWAGLYAEMVRWAEGTLLEQRAAAAGLCEPDMLTTEERAREVLDLLDRMTAALAHEQDRRSEAYLALKKGLGYCWSVAMVANPEAGKARFAGWLESADPDVRWVMRENLSKKRLQRMDAAWVAECAARLAQG
jgi:hypothetical protein